MKTIIVLLATSAVLAGATSAMAGDVQASDDATSYALSQKAANSDIWGAYASVRGSAAINSGTVYVPPATDFQSGGWR
jgi:hypothetical protein